MGMWVCTIHAKKHNGQIVTTKERFKVKQMLSACMNKLMETGDYVSMGATVCWTEKPEPRPTNIDGQEIHYVTSLESCSRRTPPEPAFHTYQQLRSFEFLTELGQCRVHCNSACGMVQYARRSSQADPAPLQQTQPVHSICIHGTKLGKCYKCRLEVLISRAESTVDEEHRCC